MATQITMENPDTGEFKNGYYGYSWTTLFFGFLPPLFRKDFKTFICACIILVVLAACTAGIGSIIAAFIWSFMYNKYYTVGLINKGFKLAGTVEQNHLAAAKLGIKLTVSNCKTYYGATA